MALDYDISLIRHGEIPVKELLRMRLNQKALIRLEQGRERIDIERLKRYQEKAQEALAENSNNYAFELGVVNNKYALIVKRIN